MNSDHQPPELQNRARAIPCDTGYDVAEWVRAKKPNLKMLLTSGYSDIPLTASEAVRDTKVLGKPYTREQLALALRDAFDG